MSKQTRFPFNRRYPDYTPITIGVSRPELALLALLRGPHPTLEQSVCRARDLYQYLDAGPKEPYTSVRTTHEDLYVLWEYIVAIQAQPRHFDEELDPYREGDMLVMDNSYLPARSE